jgi:multisubunit Na+/H+ antiporter MnhE subunit
VLIVFAEVGVWWAGTFALWWATLPATTAPELLVAAGCTLCCAIPARAVRNANSGLWKPRRAWIRWAPLAVSEVAGDALRLWHSALSRRRALTKLVTIRLGAEPAAVAAARRAIGLVALGATPATVVVDSDEERNVLVVHRVGERPSRVESSVNR